MSVTSKSGFVAGSLLVASASLAPGTASARDMIFNTPCLTPVTISVDPATGKTTWTCVVHPNGATLSTDNPDAYHMDLEPLTSPDGGADAGVGRAGPKVPRKNQPIGSPRQKPDPKAS